MKKAVIFGSGQMGQMIGRLAGADFHILCYADNNQAKQNTNINNIQVLSPADALALNPDVFILGVPDSERSYQMENQLNELGYAGEIIKTGALKIFDPRFAALRLLAEQIEDYQIPGDAAELGVYKGDFAIAIAKAFSGRTLHLFDTFEGFNPADVAKESEKGFSRAKIGDFSDTSAEFVNSRLPEDCQRVFYKGFFPDTFSACQAPLFAFVSLDADLYLPTAAALPLFWERLSPGGVIMVHDVISTQFTGVKKAVDDFCQSKKILPMPVCDLHGSMVIRKPL